MIQFLTDNFNITEEEATLFSSSFYLKEYLKGDLFVAHSKVCNHIGFVKTGILKCVSIGKHKEVIDDFAFENQFVTNI